jgi:hypothetical protein
VSSTTHRRVAAATATATAAMSTTTTAVLSKRRGTYCQERREGADGPHRGPVEFLAC